MRNEVSRHVVRGEDGKPYTIIVWSCSMTMRMSTGDDCDSGVFVRELSTGDGQPVERIQRGEYQNTTSGLMLYSESPDAP